jgi:aryl-alcohol dehydrogenase-like predicted oxidoreductase
MRYKLFGKSGLRVSELSLGTMTFGDDWGWGADKDESRKIFNAFVDAGGNFIDTACNYTNGTSEKFVGEFVQPSRDEFVVATKYTLRSFNANQKDPNGGGNNRKNMMRTVEESLRNLRTDYIDLLWLHMWDSTTPIEEVLRAMDDLVRQGKVLYIGISDTPAWVVSNAVAISELRGWSRFVGLQIPYHLASRDPERELFPMAKALDLAVTPWGVLGGGTLTGKYNSESDEPKRFESAGPKTLSAAEKLSQIAEEVGKPATQVALNWVRQQQHQANIIPIVGARREEQMKDNLGCLHFELTPEQLEKLDDVADFEQGFPRDFLESDNVRSLIFGETFPSTINHRA